MCESVRPKSNGVLSQIETANTVCQLPIAMPHKECLDLIGRCLRIQNSERILAVVYVRCIFGRTCETEIKWRVVTD